MYFPFEWKCLGINFVKPFIVVLSLFILQQPIYSSCTLSSILMRSLNWPTSSSTMTAFQLEKSGSSIVLYFLISLPLTFLLLSFNVSNLYAAPFSVRFLGTPILIPSSSYVMTFCLIHFEKVLIPVKLLVLQLSDVRCTVVKASWVFWASCSSKFSFNLTAINILFTSLTKFFSFIYYLCYCLIGNLIERSVVDGPFDFWP